MKLISGKMNSFTNQIPGFERMKILKWFTYGLSLLRILLFGLTEWLTFNSLLTDVKNSVTVNSDCYRNTIMECLWPKLINIDFCKMFFHDGVSYHISFKTIKLVQQKFPGWFISRKDSSNCFQGWTICQGYENKSQTICGIRSVTQESWYHKSFSSDSS